MLDKIGDVILALWVFSEVMILLKLLLCFVNYPKVEKEFREMQERLRNEDGGAH